METLVRLRRAAPDIPVVIVIDGDDEHLPMRIEHASTGHGRIDKKAAAPVLVLAIRRALERRPARARDPRAGCLTAWEPGSQLGAAVERSGDGMAVISASGAVLFANASAMRLVGRPGQALDGAMFGFPFGSRTCFELELGAHRFVEVHLVDVDWDCEPASLASVFDITAHKSKETDLEEGAARVQGQNLRLEKLASIDPLTEILNRRGLEAELSIELRRRRRAGGPLAAVVLDCDDFKRINETLGHAAGDAVLKELASRLKLSLRPTDHIGRVGGDEFLVLLPDTPFAEAFQVANRLRLSAFDSPLNLSSGPLHATASLAVEMVTEDIRTIDDILVCTDPALKHSKNGGKNRVSTRNDGGDAGASASEDLAFELQTGIGFRVVRQPIVRLSDGNIAAWEMFTRRAPGIFEKPRSFFRVALERNMLSQVDIGCAKACIRRSTELPRSSCCHVNIFPMTLLEFPVERFLGLFPRASAGPRFCIEVSEQQMIGEPSRLRGPTRALKDAGMLLAIDDVGFGRSSLETLIHLEPDIVKLDARFVRGASRDAGKERSLRRMIDVIGSTKSRVVAEGIEFPEDRDLLRSIGVGLGQGRLFGDPS
jgi:diguanylate cyclase (GGDEF)-like protein